MDLLGAVQYDRRRRDFDLHGVDLSTADLSLQLNLEHQLRQPF